MPLRARLPCRGDYFELLKPRVMSLVVFTALTGLVVAPGRVNIVVALASLLATAVGAGASGALNMAYEADIDALMKRTSRRPIPTGRVTSGEAYAFGGVLSVFSVMLIGLASNWLSAALLAFTILFYALVYTVWLKRATPQNIVIGGAAGALPPMIGYAIVTGSVTLDSLLLFAIIFVWTPPHFWALALLKSDDYARAGVPMMPNSKGPARTPARDPALHAGAGPLGRDALRDGARRPDLRRALGRDRRRDAATGLALLPPTLWRGGRQGRQAPVRLLDPVPVPALRGSPGRARSRPRDASRLVSAVVRSEDRDDGVVLTPQQAKNRRARNIAIGIAIAALVVLVYVLTIAKLGGHVGDRTI